MADAEIIPIGVRGRPGRGTGTSRPSTAARSLAAEPRARRAGSPPGASSRSAAPPAARGADPRVGTPPTQAPGQPAASQATPDGARASANGAGATVPPGTGPTRQRTPPALPGVDLEAPPTAGEAKPAGIPVSDWAEAFLTAARAIFGDDWERRTAELMAFVRRRLTGDYVVDDYGFDAEFTRRFAMELARPLAEKWFRIEVRGIENIPADGGALIVSNHSGTIPMDSAMTAFAVNDRTGRFLRPLGADLVFKLPVVGALARKTGTTLACNEDAERMLRGGELVGVWPEGYKGIGKPFSERYKLQRFGRGGFVSAAMRAGVPIVPLSVVGAEEIYPMIGNLASVARLLKLPYLPVTPTFPLLGPLGLIPLPSKWLMEFGEPIRTDTFEPGAAEDPMLVFNVTDQVRESIQQTLYALLVQRPSIFG